MDRRSRAKPGDPYPNRVTTSDYAGGGDLSEYDAPPKANEYGRLSHEPQRPGRTSAVIARDGGSGSFGPGRVPIQVRDALTHERGSPLADGDRWSREIGADVSGARMVTGSRAEAAADSLGARAFTLGDRVFFGRGQSPGSSDQ